MLVTKLVTVVLGVMVDRTVVGACVVDAGEQLFVTVLVPIGKNDEQKLVACFSAWTREIARRIAEHCTLLFDARTTVASAATSSARRNNMMMSPRLAQYDNTTIGKHLQRTESGCYMIVESIEWSCPSRRTLH